MGEVDAFGRGKFNCRDAVNLTLPSLLEILCHNFLCPYRQGLDCTFISAQQIIENIYGKFVLIFVDNDLVAALTQVIGCRVDSTLERLDCLIFLFGAPCVVPRSYSKIKKKRRVTAHGSRPVEQSPSSPLASSGTAHCPPAPFHGVLCPGGG